MRIAVVALDGRGTRAMPDELIRALASGNELTIDAGDERPGEVPVRAHGSGAGRLVDELPRVAGELAAAWRADLPDVVLAPSSVSGLAAGAAARELRLPLVLSLQDVGGGRPGAATAAVARTSTRVLSSSRAQADGLARAGMRRSATRVVPPGVDADAFTPADRGAGRGNRPRIVALGRIDPGSGVDDAITALRRVPDAELLVAGGPDPANPDAGRDADVLRCRRLAARAGVGRRVRMLGAVPHDAVGALLRSADVLVHVPRRAGLGRSVLEAMACGRAVVASTVDALPELVVDEVTGLLVPPARPRELGRALARLLARPAMPIAYGIAGRDRVLARFSWDRVAAAVSDVLGEALIAVP